jgi:uncharacterized repeat protein (TIGR03806 family)
MRLALLLILVGGCERANPKASCARPGDYLNTPPQKLSSYCLFENQAGVIVPASDVIAYDVNTPLFSDYALKTRLVWMPSGASAQYVADDAFDLPVGSIVAKSFAFAEDYRTPGENVRLVETRIFLRTQAAWIGLPYVWNDQQTDATLEPDGETRAIDFIDADGAPRSANYLVASERDCHSCHDDSADGLPHLIGVSARQLNGDHAYATGSENQLAHWSRLGLLASAPDPKTAPRLAVWNDSSTGNVDARARAYLDANCSHCHNAAGVAQKTNLFLRASESDPAHLGLCKPTGANAVASGGLEYDVVPGDPDHSVLAYRLASTDPHVMMPQLGRSLVHTEGLALIREWIQQLPKGDCSTASDAPDGGSAADAGDSSSGGEAPDGGVADGSSVVDASDGRHHGPHGKGRH